MMLSFSNTLTTIFVWLSLVMVSISMDADIAVDGNSQQLVSLLPKTASPKTVVDLVVGTGERLEIGAGSTVNTRREDINFWKHSRKLQETKAPKNGKKGSSSSKGKKG